MTHRERFISALERRPVKGHVPHFELVFFLTMEAFGKLHPLQRNYSQWDQMSEKERELHRNEIAEIYVEIARRYNHSAIFIHQNPNSFDETCILIDKIKERSGNEYFIMMHGDATFAIPDGNHMEEFACRIADEPEKLLDEAERDVNDVLAYAEKLLKYGGLDGFALCSDYCLNTGPFLSPSMFSTFVTPYLAKLVKGYRDMGFYTIKHTDGNIMPIIDQLIQADLHGLHSIDPQAGVDIKKVKQLYGDKVCLIGNVNCGLMQTGTDEEVTASVRYALRNGMPNGGYIFSTSNCIYTGMPIERYELILDIWKREGIY